MTLFQGLAILESMQLALENVVVAVFDGPDEFARGSSEIQLALCRIFEGYTLTPEIFYCSCTFNLAFFSKIFVIFVLKVSYSNCLPYSGLNPHLWKSLATICIHWVRF